MAARRRGVAKEIRIWARRTEAVEEARKAGLADKASTELSEVVENASMVVLCTPIPVMADLASKIREHLSSHCVVTDVGSVKGPVVREVSQALGEIRFVGSHPMAGSEKSGLAAARADLFEGATSILTPVEGTDPHALQMVDRFWSALGARTRQVDPGEHDRIMARISHTPHLVASAMVNLVCDEDPTSFNFCGNGFLDTTRVASGSPDLWEEILTANREAVLKSMEAMIRQLERAGEAVRTGEGLWQLLDQAKQGRDNTLKDRNDRD